MNRFLFIICSLMLVLLASCGSEKYNVNLYTPKTFTPGKSFPIQIKLSDSKG